MAPTTKLPFIQTVLLAYQDVVGNFAGFIKVSWLTFLIMVLFVELPMLLVQREIYFSVHPEQRVQSFNTPSGKIDLPGTEKAKEEAKALPIHPETANDVDPQHVMIMMGLSLLELLIVFCFCAAWYRQLLFDQERGKTIILKLGKLEWNFTLTSVKTAMCLAPIALVMGSYMLAAIPGFSEGEPIDIVEYWWLFAVGFAALLYLIARLSIAFPVTVNGEFLEPVKQSWNMTKGQVVPLMGGVAAMVIPVTIATILICMLAGYVFHEVLHIGTDAKNVDDSFAPHIIYKSIGGAYLLTLFALLASFCARAYAFLIRTQRGPVDPT